MRMQDVRSYTPGNLLYTMGYFPHRLDLSESRHSFKQSARRRRAIEMPTVHLFVICRHRSLLGTGEMKRLPTQRPLLFENRERAKSITAMQRNRVIENMQYAHGEIASVLSDRGDGPLLGSD